MDKHKKIMVFIPARYNSEEIFNKTLANIGGKPMIQHVHDRVSKAPIVSDIIIATDHVEIKNAVESFGGMAVMTSKDHRCGTDRIIEAFLKMDSDADIVVNVQADEPFMEPQMIEEVTKPLIEDLGIPMATLCCEFCRQEDFEYPFNVKVVKDLEGFALYFSRSPIPFQRKKGILPAYQHIGIYAYQSWFLREFPKEQTHLEKIESLEQLRVLEHGYRIKVVETKTRYKKIAVNTPEDLEKARKLLDSMQIS
ncbi:MAG: 3-deoxy-manno-octulosonate cytidylyltransferase [Promethearchaeota archaeon]